MVGSSAATTRRRMKTAKVTWESPWAATMRLVLVKYLSVCEAMRPALSAVATSRSRIASWPGMSGARLSMIGAVSREIRRSVKRP